MELAGSYLFKSCNWGHIGVKSLILSCFRMKKLTGCRQFLLPDFLRMPFYTQLYLFTYPMAAVTFRYGFNSIKLIAGTVCPAFS